jgi:hypothetical protein
MPSFHQEQGKTLLAEALFLRHSIDIRCPSCLSDPGHPGHTRDQGGKATKAAGTWRVWKCRKYAGKNRLLGSKCSNISNTGYIDLARKNLDPNVFHGVVEAVYAKLTETDQERVGLYRYRSRQLSSSIIPATPVGAADTIPTTPVGAADTIPTTPVGAADTIPTTPVGAADTIPTTPVGATYTIPATPVVATGLIPTTPVAAASPIFDTVATAAASPIFDTVATAAAGSIFNTVATVAATAGPAVTTFATSSAITSAALDLDRQAKSTSKPTPLSPPTTLIRQQQHYLPRDKRPASVVESSPDPPVYQPLYKEGTSTARREKRKCFEGTTPAGGDQQPRLQRQRQDLGQDVEQYFADSELLEFLQSTEVQLSQAARYIRTYREQYLERCKGLRTPSPPPANLSPFEIAYTPPPSTTSREVLSLDKPKSSPSSSPAFSSPQLLSIPPSSLISTNYYTYSSDIED